jgi:HAD superfamily hydrolase (TIGR01490 family)
MRRHRKLRHVTEAAFFDLDKTVIARASEVAFGRPFYREGLISRRMILRGLYGQLVYLYMGADEAKIARMRASMLDLTRGWDQARVQEIVEEALEQIVEPIIYAEALELIAQHRAAGRVVVIVSASPQEIVSPLARYLGVDRAIASRAKLDAQGRYSGEMDYDAFGPAKADAMRQMAGELGLDLEASYAYSDSATDLPMLEAVGHPVVVNPDRELLRVAQNRGWEVRNFVRPVRLRDRVAVPHPGLAAAAGAAAAAACAAVVWWRLNRRGAYKRVGPSLSGLTVPSSTMPSSTMPSSTVPSRRVRPWAAGWSPGLLGAVAGPGARPVDLGARIGVRSLLLRGRRSPQSTRSFLAARTPSVIRTASNKSFFMPSRVVPESHPRVRALRGRRHR